MRDGKPDLICDEVGVLKRAPSKIDFDKLMNWQHERPRNGAGVDRGSQLGKYTRI